MEIHLEHNRGNFSDLVPLSSLVDNVFFGSNVTLNGDERNVVNQISASQSAFFNVGTYAEISVGFSFKTDFVGGCNLAFFQTESFFTANGDFFAIAREVAVFVAGCGSERTYINVVFGTFI